MSNSAFLTCLGPGALSPLQTDVRSVSWGNRPIVESHSGDVLEVAFRNVLGLFRNLHRETDFKQLNTKSG